jgi:hypothetical protein
MKQNEIIAVDSVWCNIAPNLAQYIKPIISYEDTYWKQGRFKKEKVTYTKCMLVYFSKSKEYWMHTGFIPRVLTTLRDQKIPYTFKSEIPHVDFDDPHIEGITFRKDQNEILTTAIEQGRGVIVSATGTGKSILIRGLVGSFNQEKILFLVHTTDLVQQMMEDLEKEVDSVGEWSGKSKVKARVMVATIQSFNKVVKDFVHYFQVVVVDESVEGDQKITTNKGKIPIKEIVNKKLAVKILSWNKKTNSLNWKNIKKYHKHSPKSKMLEITIAGKTLKVTEDHKVYTSNRGWILAKHLLVNDKMLLTSGTL